MILVFLLFLKGIFANKFLEKFGQKNNFGQPRFNASCDDKSLEAAAECEDRVHHLVPKLILHSI